MPLYQQYPWSTYNQIILDLETFLAANGFTVDLAGAYNTSYRRLHVHKGEAHFEFWSHASGWYARSCTGFASGSAPTAQPGIDASARTWNVTAPTNGIHLVSTAGAVYVGAAGSANFYWGAIITSIPDKIGSWSNGFGLSGMQDLAGLGVGGAPYYASLYLNGGWTPHSGAGMLIGNDTISDMVSRQPQFYNQGIMPFPVLLGVRPADTSKFQPIGYMPGLFRANGGTLYDIAEEIVIGADTYRIFPKYGATIGVDGYGDYLFKLGA